jgi:hypothetical protein
MGSLPTPLQRTSVRTSAAAHFAPPPAMEVAEDVMEASFARGLASAECFEVGITGSNNLCQCNCAFLDCKVELQVLALWRTRSHAALITCWHFVEKMADINCACSCMGRCARHRQCLKLPRQMPATLPCSSHRRRVRSRWPPAWRRPSPGRTRTWARSCARRSTG